MSLASEPFKIVLIKPSHYDNDGYPIQWLRSLIPSNTLAAMNGLLLDCAERQVLGPDVEIQVATHDETNTRIRTDKIIRDIQRSSGRALIGIVGVQSNQFPRALDIARPFLAAGLPVALGGFHVSGCLAMLPELPPEIREAQEMGISIYAGEGEEHRLDELLRDAYAGALQPVYNYMDDLPSMEGQPVPFLTSDTIGRTVDKRSSVDLGRGCPFQCSFCTIINVQGRKSRVRSPDDLEAVIRANAAQGIFKFFITDDNFARNSAWEAMVDRLIWLRRSEGLKVKLIIQVDTLAHRIPNFIQKCGDAGVNRVFIGMESINAANLKAANKRQNKISEYRLMFQQWNARGITTYAGFIHGFAHDSKESILADIETIKRELPVAALEFSFLTPLPGSADHKRLLAEGTWMDPDLNKYDLSHRVTHHPTMSDEDWDWIHWEAWRSFYSRSHVETIIRRSAASRRANRRLKIGYLVEFFLMATVEKMHPQEGGVFRLKFRRDRRFGMPLENPLKFYPAYAIEMTIKAAKYATATAWAYQLFWRVNRDPKRFEYTDTAIEPIEASEVEAAPPQPLAPQFEPSLQPAPPA